MVNKKGLSAIVALTMIVLLTVVAVTILWTTIIPMMRSAMESTDKEFQLISVSNSDGYTFYDAEEKTAYVQISRGPDEREITEIHILYSVGGTSHVFVINGSRIPNPNGLRTIVLPLDERPDSVRVVAYYVDGSSIKSAMPSELPIHEGHAAEPAQQGDYTPSTDPEGNVIVDEEGNIL